MLKKIALWSLACLLVYTAGVVGLYFTFNDNLPDVDELERFRPKRITKVYSADGLHLRDFLEENRELLESYDEIPEAMRNALVAVEDRRFFSHWGIDIRRIFGAVRANILSLDPTAEGASTLTQQLARNLYQKVGRQRSSATLEGVMASYARKIREQITAVHIERLYTKREILTMYLNTVFFGHDAYGLKSAARLYFDKEVGDLAVEECALLAGLLPAPNSFSPLVNPERARQRRNLVLRDMWRSGRLARPDYERLQRTPLGIRRGQRAETYGLGPYFVEYVRQQLNRAPGEQPATPAAPPGFGAALYRDGYTVRTTLDTRLQRIAEKHFDTEIGKVQKVFDAYLAAQPAAGLPATATVQAALLAMDPATGHVLAMIGGRDFDTNEFNRATQAARQPGSAFKPFVFTAALDNGIFPIDVYEDNAITISETTGEIWDPENYDRKFLGWMTLREAFKQSRNLVSIKLAMEVGPERVRQYARSMGVRSPIRAVYSIGVGTSAVRLLELVAAYSVFPNRGIYVEPVAVETVTDADGNSVFDAPLIRREVLRPSVAVLMTDMMRSVIDEPRGTGHAVRTVYGFRPDAAGKTGTTNNYADAWFIGFTPDLVVGVWVGIDDPSLSLAGQTGARAALPLWARFMQDVYREVPEYRSRANVRFEYPEGLLVRRAVCEESHKLATKYCPRQSEELFIADGALPEICPLHSGEGGGRRRTQRF
ncbi:MAG: PBP1A family penicillin-binding protein [Gemmatimonadota bacterium]